MSKNIVICCDGTNNSLAGTNTNIAHLNALARTSSPESQLVYYDAGVGVEAHPACEPRSARQ